MNRSKPTLVPIVLIFLIASLISSCSPIISSELPYHTDLVLVQKGKNLGQSFVARFDGLNAVDIYIKPENIDNGQLVLTIWDGPDDTSQLLGQSSLNLEDITDQGFYSLTFLEQKSSTNKYYYINLSIEGNDSLFIGINDGSAYYNGALYKNDQPENKQLTFRLQYNRIRLLIGLIIEGLFWLSILLVGIWLFVLPGWAILSITLQNWDKLIWGVKLGLSVGTSLAFYPLLFLWTDLLGIHLGALYAWLPSLASLVVIVWRNRLSVKQSLTGFFQPNANIKSRRNLAILLRAPEKWLPDVILFTIILLLFFSRFWHIRNLDAPMWGDSYQHTMMAQLFVDNAGLFNTWEPYVPYYSLTVHFGFSAAVALVKWISGLPVQLAALVTGQLLNGLAIVTLIPLAKRFAPNSRWAGIGVAIVAGFFTLMPAYYVNWGRYAQLAGQVILPVIIWLVWEAVIIQADNKNSQKRGLLSVFILVASLVLGGMYLSYYRMAFFFSAFILVWLIIWGLLFLKLNIRRWIVAIIILGSVAAISLIFVLPWLPKLTGSTLAQAVEAGVTIGSPLTNVILDYQVWRDINLYYPLSLLFLGALSLMWAVFRRKWILFILPLWFGVLIAYISGQVFHIPGANMLQNFTIMIALYIPLGLAIGWLVDYTAQLAEEHGKTIASAIIPIVLLALTLVGFINIRTISKPDTYGLVLRPDTRAMSWIQQNISGDTRFLVEGFRIYGGTSAVGSDAGWWISLLAKRENSMPPQYALSNEIPIPSDYSLDVVELIRELESKPIDTKEAIPILCNHRITHIYIGQGQGKVGAGANQLFTASQLSRNDALELIYNQDKVFIYSLKPQACENNS